MSLAALSDDDRYHLWRFDAGQNNRRLAELLSIPEGTVHSWVSRGRWRARARADDVQEFGDAVSWARRQQAQQLREAIEVQALALASRYGKDGLRREGDPTPIALKASDNTLARFGITPVRHYVLETRDTEQATHDQIARVIASRDADALLALLQGQPLPDHPDGVIDAESVMLDGETD